MNRKKLSWEKPLFELSFSTPTRYIAQNGHFERRNSAKLRSRLLTTVDPGRRAYRPGATIHAARNWPLFMSRTQCTIWIPVLCLAMWLFGSVDFSRSDSAVENAPHVTIDFGILVGRDMTPMWICFWEFRTQHRQLARCVGARK